MNKIEITVCIPVWNVEAYIKKCLESVFNQTYIEKTEIIIVNDCTPDNSIKVVNELIDQYSQYRDKIRIITHEKNKGLAAARNTALKNAKGKYIIQVDSDDWLEPDYLEKLYNAAELNNADIAGCDYYLELVNETKVVKENLNLSPSECLKNILKTCQGIIWTKLIRKNLFSENNITWVEGLDMGEDLLICSKLFAHAKKIINVDKPLYHYRKTNPNSFCNDTKKVQYKLDCLLNVTNNVITYLSAWSPLYDNEFLLMKARIKQICLFLGDYKIRKQVYKLYPECDKLLVSIAYSRKMKLLLFCVANKLYTISELLFRLRRV